MNTSVISLLRIRIRMSFRREKMLVAFSRKDLRIPRLHLILKNLSIELFYLHRAGNVSNFV